MKTLKGFYTTKVVAILLTALTLQACGNASDKGTVQGPIFTEAKEEASQTIQAADAEVRRKRNVNVNFDIVRNILSGHAGTITLNLFDDKIVTIVLDNVNKISDANYVATGHIAGQPDSAATLVMNKEVFTATVKSDDETYEVNFGGNGGVHVVSEPKEKSDDENSCSTVDAPVVPGDEPLLDESSRAEGQDGVLATPVIDMFVAYTPNARSRVGGTSAMQALIQTAIADTNTALTYSAANLQVRLVGTMEMISNETCNWSNDLYRLRTTDGKWDQVHSARTKYGADQVTLIGSYSSCSSSTAGIGYIKASKSYAFTIVKTSVIKTMYTFAHELGHNIGLNHSDGYVNYTGKFRTIMAYGSYSRIRRFSNPNKTYNGYRTGTSSDNSVSIINYNNTRMASLLPTVL